MRKKVWILILLLLIISHIIHYQVNKIRQPFYNTEFSVKDLPLKFYKINVGDSKSIVEQQIGKPFSIYNKDIYNYSERGGEILFGNYCAYFQILYHNDTVLEKRIIFDD